MTTRKNNFHFKKLLLLSFILTTAVVVFSYFLLDQPIAFFVNQLHLPFDNILIGFTKIKPYVYLSSLIGIIVYFFLHQKVFPIV